MPYHFLTMTVELSRELQAFVQQEVASGKYHDENAVLEEALELLRRRHDWEAQARAGAKQGIADIKAGRYTEIKTPKDVLALRQEISHRAKEQRAKRKQTS